MKPISFVYHLLIFAFFGLNKVSSATSQGGTLYDRSSVSDFSVPKDASSSEGSSLRLEKIKSMYAWEGFVYDIEACKVYSELVEDFLKIKATGARNIITFDYCGTGADPAYYDDLITAAGVTGLNIIPLVWTLPIHPVGQNYTANDTFAIKSVPRIEAVIKAVIQNPGPVLAVALGDEPLYDNDAGSPDALASYIVQMKENFREAGFTGELDIPVSISELAYGWQSSGNITSVANAVDFFMANDIPYFGQTVRCGGDNLTWQNFLADMAYYASIADGRPILVTQTGWPSNEDTFAPNSPYIIASVACEKAYWNLLDSHCDDWFKTNNVGWMWRTWDDAVDGWGVNYLNGTEKWPFKARLQC